MAAFHPGILKSTSACCVFNGIIMCNFFNAKLGSLPSFQAVDWGGEGMVTEVLPCFSLTLTFGGLEVNSYK
jgi:hypothetical protein